MPRKPKPKLPKLTFSSGKKSMVDGRLREIILYVASRCENAERFGAIKLNKIIAFADFNSFGRRGIAITGAEYMRQPNGPVPRQMKPILEQLKREGAIAIAKVPVGKFVEHRVIPLREADLSVLTPQDVAMIDEVIALTWESSGKQVSDFSHGRAWEVAGSDGIGIPYEAVFLSDGPISAAAIARTRELNRKFNWETPKS